MRSQRWRWNRCITWGWLLSATTEWNTSVCRQAKLSKAREMMVFKAFKLLSLSAFKIQILKASPFVGQGYPGYMSRVSSPALISDSPISAPDEQCVCERERECVCVWTASAHWKIDYLYSKWVGQNKHGACSGFKDCGGAVTQHWHGSDTRCQHQPWWSSGR